MEKVLTSETVPVNRVHKRRPQNSKGQRYKKKAPHKQKDDNRNMSLYCGFDHEGPRSKYPASGETYTACSKKGHFAKMCKGKQKGSDKPKGTRSAAKWIQPEQDSSSDFDFVFQLQPGSPHSGRAPTVHVLINGVKGKVEADWGSSANILDEKKFQKLQDALEQKVSLQPTDTKPYAFAQK